MLGLGCLGCWQEIRYEPDKSTLAAKKDVADESEPSLPKKPAPEQSPTPSPEIFPSQPEPRKPETSEPLPGQATEASTPLLVEPSAKEGKGEEPVDLFGDMLESVAQEKEGVAPPVAVAPSAEAKLAEVRRTMLAVWQMSSHWSMATALQAKGKDSYDERLEMAHSAAKLLGVSLPPLPEYQEGTSRLATSLSYLLEDAGPRLASDLSERHSRAHAALAELATKTHVLLLCYTPRSNQLEPVIAAIRQAAKNSGLSEDVWRELIDLLAARAEFKPVKAAIYQLHQRATAHLSGEG